MIRPNGNMVVNCDAAKEGGTKFDIQQVQQAVSRLEGIDRRLVLVTSNELEYNAEKSCLEQQVDVFLLVDFIRDK